jgi:hypothetical protein
VSLRIDKNDIANSVHRTITCVKCHSDVSTHLARPCQTAGKVDCSNCHAEVSNVYTASGHGVAYNEKHPEAPYCTTCHGTHTVKSRYDDTSPTYRSAIPTLCGNCHRTNGKANEKTELKEVNAFSDYSQSVHEKGLREKAS